MSGAFLLKPYKSQFHETEQTGSKKV